VIPPVSEYPSNGPWFLLENAERYIGIRHQTDTIYKYGWLKVNATSRNEIRLTGFAIEI
jgi:hypothetical protein